MHHDPLTASALIETMKLASRVAMRATNPKVRAAANELADKAFRQYIWG